MKFKYNPLLILLFTVLLSSCVNNLKFDQIELDIDPVSEFPLVFFELNQNDFFDVTTSTEVDIFAGISDIEVLESSVIRDNLLRADLRFEVVNRFDRNFTVDVEFLDTNNMVTFTFDRLFIAPGATNFSAIQNVIIADTPAFLNSSQIRVTVRLTPSTTILDPNIPRTFDFKSAATLYLSF